MIEAIKNRRSVREYLAEGVSEDQITEIITAAMYAPSARGLYPWDLVVIKDRDVREKLAKVTPWSAHVKDAPVVIAVVGHSQDSAQWLEDGAIVAEHIWLEATNQGLASCWTQIYSQESAQIAVKEILNVPEEYFILCLMPIGVPTKSVEVHTEKDFDKSRIKYEKYR